MSTNPYDPPESHVQDRISLPAIPPEVAARIKYAWMAGVISGVITLGATLLAISGTSVLGFTAWQMVDVVLIFGLAFGIYRKSRVCAVLMLLYFIAAKVMIISEFGLQSSGLLMSLIFAWCYSVGVLGTFQYHKIVSLQSSGDIR